MEFLGVQGMCGYICNHADLAAQAASNDSNACRHSRLLCHRDRADVIGPTEVIYLGQHLFMLPDHSCRIHFPF